MIEFRGIAIGTGKWVYGYLIGLAEIRVYITDEWQGQYDDIMVDPNTVGQLKNRKDKNGINIYEGDFVRYNSKYIFMIDPFTPEILKPINDNSSDNQPFFDVFFEHSNKFEVIGNIYENTELLKQ